MLQVLQIQVQVLLTLIMVLLQMQVQAEMAIEMGKYVIRGKRGIREIRGRQLPQGAQGEWWCKRFHLHFKQVNLIKFGFYGRGVKEF